MKVIAYAGWKNCVMLENKEIELVVTADVGPRVIRFGFKGSRNFFREMDGQTGRTGGDTWLIYGGHRLWHAPEQTGRTDYPDNESVRHEWNGRTLKLVPPLEKTTGIQKEMEITLDPDKNRVRVNHRLINRNLWDIRLSVWALSVMDRSGRAVVPQEPYFSHGPGHLLPIRPIALWEYTKMGDPRWTWGSKYIQLRQDPEAKVSQKIGVLNRQGWAAYVLGGEVFIKKFPFRKDGEYPDYNTNTQIYTDANILEVETLGPLTTLAPGEQAEHWEEWSLHKADIPADEAGIERIVGPLL